MSVLSLENVKTGYGKKQVLFDISFNIEEGQCVLFVGSNGSGKSTLFKAIYRDLDLWGKNGRLFYNEEDLTKFKAHHLIEKGIMYIPQKDELFEDLTVRENLELSVLHLKNRNLTRSKIENILIAIPTLKLKLEQRVNSLSGGERKILSLAMVLLNKPKLLLYDEPLAGLSDENVKILLKYLDELKEMGITLLLIEHRIKELFPLADRIIGLQLGHKNKHNLGTLKDIKEIML